MKSRIKKYIVALLLAFAAWIALAAVLAVVVTWAWNYLSPLMGAPQVSFQQVAAAFVLLAATRILLR